MYEIQLKEGLRIEMPENLKEVTADQYCEFLWDSLAFIDWQNKKVEEKEDPFSPQYQIERMEMLTNIVDNFFAGDLDVFNLKAGDYTKSLKLTFQVDNIAEIDLPKTEGTLYNLWALIYKAISVTDFSKPSVDFSFEWKGETYYLKESQTDKFTGATLPPDWTVQEAVEVLDLRRKANKLMELNKAPKKNIQFELLHKQLALLALKAGEELPVNELEFERFVSERAAHFVGIDAEIALQVDFFLSGALGLFNNTLTVISYGTHLDRIQLKQQSKEVV
jgi:hypothetical protein